MGFWVYLLEAVTVGLFRDRARDTTSMDQESKRLLHEALTVPHDVKPAYKPFMMELMHDVCIRTTLMLLKNSWKKHMIEFDKSRDLSAVCTILREFPHGHLDEDEIYEKDTRSLALEVFYKMWDVVIHFLQNPPYTYYAASKTFISNKMHLLGIYNKNEIVRMEIQSGGQGFGNEERQWVQDEYWRSIYMQKLHAYFEAVPEIWRISQAMNHPYFLEGMQTAMNPPPPPVEWETASDYEREMRFWSDSKVFMELLLQEDTGLQGLAETEMERRTCAKQILSFITQRWGIDEDAVE